MANNVAFCRYIEIDIKKEKTVKIIEINEKIKHEIKMYRSVLAVGIASSMLFVLMKLNHAALQSKCGMLSPSS